MLPHSHALGCRCVSTASLQPEWRPDSLGCALLVAQPSQQGMLHLQLLFVSWHADTQPQWVATVPLDGVSRAHLPHQGIFWAPDSTKLAVQQGSHAQDRARLLLLTASGQLLASSAPAPCGVWIWAPCGTLLACLSRGYAVSLHLLDPARPESQQLRQLPVNTPEWGFPCQVSGRLWAPYCRAGPLLLILPPPGSGHMGFVAGYQASLTCSGGLLCILAEGFLETVSVACSFTHVAAAVPSGCLVTLCALLPGPRLSLVRKVAIRPVGSPASCDIELEFSPTGALLACCGTFEGDNGRSGCTLHFWLVILEVASGQVLARLERQRAVHHGPVYAVYWADDGHKLLVDFASIGYVGRSTSVFTLPRC